MSVQIPTNGCVAIDIGPPLKDDPKYGEFCARVLLTVQYLVLVSITPLLSTIFQPNIFR